MKSLNRLDHLALQVREQVARFLDALKDPQVAAGIKSAWMFGSAIDTDKHAAPGDIDVALISDDPSGWPRLSAALSKRFPSSRVEAGGYTRTAEEPSKPLSFHFVLVDALTIRRLPKLARSIKAGICAVA